jgi:Phosphate-selective porin O and P
MLEPLSIGAMLLIEATLLIEALIECGVLVYVFASAVAAIGLFVATSPANADAPSAFFEPQDVVARSDDRVQPLAPSVLIKPLDYHLSSKVAVNDNLSVRPAYYPLLAQKSDSTSNVELPTIPAPSNYGATEPVNPTPPVAEGLANQVPPTSGARINRLPPPAEPPVNGAPPAAETLVNPSAPSTDARVHPAPPVAESLANPPPPTAEALANPTPPTAEATGGVNQPALVSPMTEFEKELKKNEEEAEEKEAEKPIIPDLARGILIATNDGDLTFKPGLRIQPRFIHDDGNGNNDFFIRRFRLKGSGSAYGIATYGVELREDNEERFFVQPNARVENAWLDFPTRHESVFLRAGLYDLPFSRDALTSDSKLLFMDRSLIKEQLTLVGMADNTDGVMLHGRPHCGRYEYAFGIFDSDQFERFGPLGTRESDHLMPAGRFVWNLADPMTPPGGYADYQQSYIGKGHRLEIGTNAAHLSHAIDGLDEFDLTAWGVDCFANSGPYTFQAEYDQILEDFPGDGNVYADGWYAQFGYLFLPYAELALRYETLDPLIGDTLRWTRVGFNFYIREHNLKIQTDYCFRSHNELAAPLPFGSGQFDEDVFEVQLQLDF